MLVVKKVKVGASVDLYEIFERVNYDLFDGELDKPILGTTFVPDIAGFMLPWAGMYHIAIALDQDYDEGLGTLVHEMIHIWQHMNGSKMHHDAQFVRKCREAEELYGFEHRQVEGTENSDEPLYVD